MNFIKCMGNMVVFAGLCLSQCHLSVLDFLLLGFLFACLSVIRIKLRALSILSTQSAIKLHSQTFFVFLFYDLC